MIFKIFYIYPFQQFFNYYLHNLNERYFLKILNMHVLIRISHPFYESKVSLLPFISQEHNNFKMNFINYCLKTEIIDFDYCSFKK